jgi:hypothetical protein
MSLRRSLGLLVAVWLLAASGCCWLRPAPWPCGRTYYGTQCGCKYWHEWFSHKPPCCEPCDGCGNFTASHNPYVVTGPPYTRFGPLYSDGTRTSAPGSIGQMYPTPAEPTPAESAPAESPPAAEEPGVMETEPTEELPGPTTQAPPSAVPRMTERFGPVDSPRYSRTLGKSPRTRLFFR